MRRAAFIVLTIGCLSCGAAAAADESAATLFRQAQLAAARGDSEQAVQLAGQVLARDAEFAEAYYLRGREYFRLNQVEQSVADFDRYVARRPEIESRQWERGIALYYAKQYRRGAQQFELYQTFHANDVENSVWRYLCMVPEQGVAKARAVMLPIDNDRRVPMMQVYRLYRGELTPGEVLAACEQGSPAPEVLAGRLFYAHLYLGLYHEVAGETELARKYILLAAEPRLATNDHINRYMWDVARIHAATFKPNRES